MKKQILFLSLAGFAATANAQVTITSADQPVPLQVYLQAQDTNYTQTPGNPGASQTYNFTCLNQQEDTMTFTLPQWTPYGTNYPNSNMAVEFNGGAAFFYGNFSSSIFEVNGQAADPLGTGIIALTFSNPETQMIYPAAYGSSFADTAGGVNQFYYGMDPGIGFTVDSIRIKTWIFKASDYDGWGTCTTPLGTNNVLRQNTYRLQVDTLDIYAFGNWATDFYIMRDSARTYSYWANGIGMPVAELEEGYDLGTTTNFTWLPAMPTVSGVSTLPATQIITSYPNPASDAIIFNTDANEGVIEIIDMTGRVVKTANINSTSTYMNVTDLADGMYTYRVTTTNVVTGKVQVAH